MTDNDPPAFDVALVRLQQFLETQNIRRPMLRWLFREDVALAKRSLLVSSRLPADRTSLVAEKYARAVATAARGVVLGAHGIDDHTVYCSLYVPVSDDDAEYRLICGLKLSVLTPLLTVKTLDAAKWAKAASSLR